MWHVSGRQIMSGEHLKPEGVQAAVLAGSGMGGPVKWRLQVRPCNLIHCEAEQVSRAQEHRAIETCDG